ncbi:hypothetical protein EG327_007616 [Venturia inaequalis]|uniref:Uncharacterized protein n=1 Tax=Venturia inaequalis TaxID=5025 RepID=A0A8H3Z1Z7_VENIN|nr:hypothetical protein EG327_007616 [Venturia inaequalis]
MSISVLKTSVVNLPTFANRVSNFPPEQIALDALSTHIIIHPRLIALFEDFLIHKRIYGSLHEKDLYKTAETYSWKHLTSRLVEKRPLAFFNGSDQTLLRDGTQLSDSANQWDRNGTDQQHFNTVLTLEEYLSYDEIFLSSLIGVSGWTYFINRGSRNNYAKKRAHPKWEERGVIIGLVGARFEREGRMDSSLVLPPSPSDFRHPHLRTLFLDFFGPAKQTVREDFDEQLYVERMRITIETLLLEANARAKDMKGKKAFIHVVGLGLGVWQYSSRQPSLYIATFTSSLRTLKLPHVSTVNFSWIDNVLASDRDACVAAGLEKGLMVEFSKRDPAEPLENPEEEFLVVSYAWDGNAMPGNEYWLGMLGASGDPAAACCSTIAELHNPLVNPYAERIVVAGE